jgi:hypothetical protein
VPPSAPPRSGLCTVRLVAARARTCHVHQNLPYVLAMLAISDRCSASGTSTARPSPRAPVRVPQPQLLRGQALEDRVRYHVLHACGTMSRFIFVTIERVGAQGRVRRGEGLVGVVDGALSDVPGRGSRTRAPSCTRAASPASAPAPSCPGPGRTPTWACLAAAPSMGVVAGGHCFAASEFRTIARGDGGWTEHAGAGTTVSEYLNLPKSGIEGQNLPGEYWIQLTCVALSSAPTLHLNVTRAADLRLLKYTVLRINCTEFRHHKTDLMEQIQTHYQNTCTEKIVTLHN